MLWLYRIINGYLRVRFKGEFSERILNFAAANRITLWDSRLIKDGIESCVSVKDFKRLRSILRGSKIRVHIIKKNGLPFKVDKNKKRFGLICGAIFLIVFLEFMSQFIWVIDVKGNSKVKSEEIIAVCEKIGIKKGIAAGSINAKSQRERLLLQLESLSWASLNIEGCRITVNVRELKKTEKENTAPGNLKAKADGIIKKMDIVSGNSVVKQGDTVKKGDVLVSGIIEKADGTQFVSSGGSVTAVTERSFKVEGKYIKALREETGETATKKVLELFTLKIPLFLGSENGEYNSSTSIKNIKLFGQSLPITVYSKEFRYVKSGQITLSREELCAELEKEVEKQLAAEGITEYSVLESEFADIPDGIALSAIVSAEENIAYYEPFLITE